jgi:hypothetical protein
MHSTNNQEPQQKSNPMNEILLTLQNNLYLSEYLSEECRLILSSVFGRYCTVDSTELHSVTNKSKDWSAGSQYYQERLPWVP